MKTIRITAGLLALSGVCALAQSAFAAETVEFNKTHIMRLSAPAGAVVIGNPNIADISVHSDNTLFVFGRSFGQTDILILDAAGNTLVHTDINVVEASPTGSVRIIAPGRDRETYDCSPYCRPAPAFADRPDFKGKFSGKASGGGGGTAGASGPAGDPAQQLSGGAQLESARAGLSGGESGGNIAQSARGSGR